MCKIFSVILFLYFNAYSYQPAIKMLIDSISLSAGDGMVGDDYYKNFNGLVDKLEKYFYAGNSDPLIGEVLFSAYDRLQPPLQWGTMEGRDSAATAYVLKPDTRAYRKYKVLNYLVNSKDSASAVVLRLLYTNSEIYYNNFPEVKNIDYDTFKKQILNKLIKSSDAGVQEIVMYLQTIPCDNEHKQKIDSICRNVYEGDSKELKVAGVLSICASCLKESMSDDLLLKYYLRMKEIQDANDYSEGTIVEELIEQQKLKIKAAKSKK